MVKLILAVAVWVLFSGVWMILEDIQIEKPRKRIEELEDA